jgi:transposase
MSAQQLDNAIWELHCCHISKKQIAQKLHVGYHRISDVIQKFPNGERLDHEMGRPKKLGQEIRNEIARLTLTDGGMCDQDIADHLRISGLGDISRSSVNVVRHNKHFHFGPPKRCQKLNANQILIRRQFVRDWSEGHLFEGLKALPLVFSDESRFSLHSDNRWTWQGRGTYRFHCMKQSEKFARFSIMVWGAIGLNFRSSLVICSGTIGTKEYIEFLNRDFFTEADNHFGNRKWVFMQDGAPCHSSESSISNLQQHCLLFPFWPPNSPDLNPIETVWGIMKRKLKYEGITTQAAAIEEIKQTWNSLDLATVNQLVNSFPMRVRLVGEAQGQTIQPLLSAHKTSVPEDYLPDRISPEDNPWTVGEDEIICLLIFTNQTRFDGIEPYLPGRDRMEIKRRFTAMRIAMTNSGQIPPTVPQERNIDA